MDKYLEKDRGYSTPCWIWQGYKNLCEGGYGSMWFNGKTRQAHKVYYEKKYGSVPFLLVLDHLCKQKDCVNPDHMQVVTQKENVRRSSLTNLNKKLVTEIRTAIANGELQKDIAVKYNISRTTVCDINKKHTWR